MTRNQAEKLIDEKIEKWHRGLSNKSLHEYLGWTWKEYTLWLEENILPAQYHVKEPA